jgi:hypothetical protein
MHCRVVQVMGNYATYCTAIALTFTCEAAGSRRVGEIMVSLFFGGCVVCCGCVLGDGSLCL